MPSTSTVHSMYAARGAELYDRIVADDTSEVREIIRTIARGSDRVLELASGSGRLTVPLLRVARDVTAVDISPDLTAMLRARVTDDARLQLVVADILAWDSEERFDKVVLGTTSISLFDRADRARLFARVRRWLAEDGSFVLSLRTPPLADDGQAVHDIGGGLRIREEIDSERGILSTTLTEDGDASEHTVRTHLLSRPQLVDELHAAGFTVTAQHPVGLRGHDDRIGDYAVLVASVSSPSEADSPPVRGTSAYLEFFLPPSRFGEIEADGAEGVTVSFSDGSTAIDAISGLWNVPLGYGSRAIADAVHQVNLQASALPIFRRGSTSARQAAERLREYAGADRYESVFFATSGSSALDAVVKLSRQVQKLVHGARRRRVVSLVGSYHGITSTAMALSGAYLYQDVYDVDERLHIKIPYDDVDALRRVARRFGEEIAAIVMEPVLGSGALPLPTAMLHEVARLREQRGFLVVADEVATGFYRTGVRVSRALSGRSHRTCSCSAKRSPTAPRRRPPCCSPRRSAACFGVMTTCSGMARRRQDRPSRARRSWRPSTSWRESARSRSPTLCRRSWMRSSTPWRASARGSSPRDAA
ncbi:aminotransferase class III-fold pyridoxal phosphate-dependent enzyme [Microbacterium sp. NEAU-LLB]|uniref:Aminotransferase class III-fold pyridoxal phosphate-dependent enzyme n=1 Tax=Microbacterium stercoris TaxID=2820289 RepID=A0A939TU46_9MICO|nr:daptide-type RiPP biosynthesis methyltransferase [Microbacterium stercoris]MBO3663644.1 aminotransferase class III-fold pyridoxal phosphate-dependent enzyme [Microbacterium stercoris]